MARDLDKYSDAHQVIENMARVKLAMNSHKGSIEDCSTDEIISMLRGEVDELEEAKELIHVIEEAADVYNFVLARVHKAITEYRGRK